MQKAQFERIFGQSARQFGKMRKGDEERFAMILFPMEGNALKVHRQYPKSNSIRLREAIALVLYDIQERCGGRKVDVSKFRKESNERLEHALLMAFDPFTNEEAMEALGGKEKVESMTPEELRAMYKYPVQCLLRIKSSIDLWEKNLGSNGYFTFIEGYMGRKITGDKMNYSVVVR